MKHENFIHELTVGYKYLNSVSKRRLYYVNRKGEIIEASDYSLIVTEGGARFLVKWGPSGSRQHQWCCLNEAAQNLCRDLAKLEEPVKNCPLMTYAEAKEKARSSMTVQQAVKGQAAPAPAPATVAM